MTFEDLLRRHLRELADEGGPTERLRTEVRARLESLEEGAEIFQIAAPPPRRRPSWSAAAAIAVLVAGVVGVTAWLASGGGDDVVTDGERSTSTSAPVPLGERRRSATDPAFEVTVPTNGVVGVRPSSETARTWVFEVTGPSLSSPGQIAFAVPGLADDRTVDARMTVVDLVSANLAQVELIDATDTTFAGAPAIRMRLESVRSMTLVGFRLGTQTFLSASGIDREYELYVLTRPDGGALVVSIDASAGELGELRDTAEAMTRSLTWVG